MLKGAQALKTLWVFKRKLKTHPDHGYSNRTGFILWDIFFPFTKKKKNNTFSLRLNNPFVHRKTVLGEGIFFFFLAFFNRSQCPKGSAWRGKSLDRELNGVYIGFFFFYIKFFFSKPFGFNNVTNNGFISYERHNTRIWIKKLFKYLIPRSRLQTIGQQSSAVRRRESHQRT